MNPLSHLPGGELIAEGLQDTAAGRITPAACLIAVGWPRLLRAGLTLPRPMRPSITEPEQRLYQILRETGGDAYSRYNALMRELISFERAMERHQKS
jgi:hypothetical protein